MKEFKQYLHKQKTNSSNFNREKGTKEDNREEENMAKESSENLEFVPGVIVTINLSKAYSEAKKLKVCINQDINGFL